jgi:hypothetical protein
MDTGPITTAISKIEGRLKVGVVCPHGKKKCLKCAIKKSIKDGKGGTTMPKLNFPIGSGSYGAKSKTSYAPPKVLSMTAKKHKSVSIPGGLKPKGIKKMKFNSSLKSALLKSMKIGKIRKLPKGMKAKSLKAIIKGN